MLDQSLLQSHFIGRDGFRWWIGQIPPLSSMGSQVAGGGWGNRFKVRIIGYHPYSEADLPNEDLPWAQCLIPTTSGSGAANAMTGVQLQQGDVVLGFFLDGDNAQIPVILATFGRTDSVPSTTYQSPFQGFTGFSNFIEKNSKLTPSESNELKSNSNPSPPSVTQEQAGAISQRVGYQVFSENSAIGSQVPLANTVKNTQVDKIKSIVKNLLRKLKRFQGNVAKIRTFIGQAVDKIVTLCNDVIGQMFDFLVKNLMDLLGKGVKLLYKLVFAKVLAATGNKIAAHAAGVLAQQLMVVPVKALEEVFACIAGEVIEQIKGIVSDILTSVIGNVDRFVSCAAEQFAGTLFNSVIGVLEGLFEGPLATVSNLLQFFSDFNLGNTLRKAIGVFSQSGIGFGCNQNFDSYKGLVNEWVLGGGPSGSVSTLASSMAGTYESIQNISNIVNTGIDINSVNQCFTEALTFASPPIINIFGGRGSGASAIPIFGNITTNPDGNAVASVIGVQLTNSGSGYVYPPFIEIIDDNDQGYGAFARSIINENGEVESIYMVSEGENYSIGNVSEYSVLNVIIENQGSGYNNSTTKITDDLGNSYDYKLDSGRIYQVSPLNNIIDSLPILTVTSDTGFGAILRPVLGIPRESTSTSSTSNVFSDNEEIKISIDCIT